MRFLKYICSFVSLSAAIWAVASLVLLSVVCSDPIVGYADNFDFTRIEACSGVWPVAGPPNVPVRNYVRTGRLEPSTCMPSVDLVFPRLATVFKPLGGTLDIRVVGIMRAAVLIIGTGVLIAVRRRHRVSLLVSTMFALVACDLAFTSYFNTFYAEFSVIAGIFLLIAACCVLFDEKADTIKRRTLVSAFYVGLAGSVLLIFSKEQYASIGIIYSLILAAVLAFYNRERAAAVALVAVIGPLLFSAFSGRVDSDLGRAINFANKTDTYLWAVLPNSTDVAQALSILGLPSSCAEEVGKYWYLPGADKQRPCPSVQDVSRSRLILLFLSQPRTFLVPMTRAITLSRPWHLDYLGQFGESGTKRNRIFRLASALSVSRVADGLAPGAYFALVVSYMGLGLCSAAVLCLRLVRKNRPGMYSDVHVAASMGAFAIAYGLFSSVFGDGYWEFAKHAVSVGLGCLVVTAALAASSLRWAAARGHVGKSEPDIGTGSMPAITSADDVASSDPHSGGQVSDTTR